MNTILSQNAQRAQRSSVHETGGTPIRVQDLGCSRARRLARDYAHAYRINYGTPRHLDRFACRWIRLGDDVGVVRCRVGHGFAGFDIYDSSPFH
jgi:hypothetical protein